MKKVDLNYLNKKSKLISEFVIFGLSILVFIVAIATFYKYTYGWFTVSKNASIGGFNFEFNQSDEVKVDINVHKCIKEIEEDKYIFQEQSNTNLKLGTYSYVGDKAYSLLLEVSFNETVKDVTLSSITKTTYFLGDGLHPLYISDNGKGAPLYDYDLGLTSIVSLCVLNTVDENYVYNNAPYYMAYLNNTNIALEETFINSDGTVKSSIPLVNKNELNKGDKLWILITYSEPLVQHVLSANIGNEAITKDDDYVDSVIYCNDFGFELVGSKKE